MTNTKMESITTIFEILQPFNRNFIKHDGKVGIEIETETLKPYKSPEMKFWNVVPDGSLRHFGQEYVLSAPMSFGNGLEDAFEEFNEKTKGLNFIQGVYSTSVHVHLNFLNERFLTLANFFTAYALYENLLIKYSGPDRVSNLFCLPIRHAEQIKDNILRILSQIDANQFRSLARQNVDNEKYGAINTASFAQRGSIEIRSFRGETDLTVVGKWVQILLYLMEYAKNQKSPVLIIEHWRDRGLNALNDIFGDLAEELKDQSVDLESLVKQNLWYAASIATVSKDWSKFGVIEKVAKKTKNLEAEHNAQAMNRFGMLFNDLSIAQKIVVIEDVERNYYMMQPVPVIDFGQVEQPDVRDVPRHVDRDIDLAIYENEFNEFLDDEEEED